MTESKSVDNLLVSNMFPSATNPLRGIFVKRIADQLRDSGIGLDQQVYIAKGDSKLGKLLGYVAFYWRVVVALMFGGYQRVYIHYASHCAIPVLIARLFKNFEIITHVHGGDVKLHSAHSKLFFRIKTFFSKRLILSSDTVVVPSKNYREMVEQSFGANNTLVYPSGGVDLSLFDAPATKIKPTVSRLGYAGRLEALKRVDWVISSFAKLQQVYPDLQLDIVGDGSVKQQLKEQAKALGVDGKVTFSDTKNQAQLVKWLQTLDALVYPSESESLGLMPLESMACGVVPILSDIPAFAEYISDDNGYLCSDEESLYLACREFMSLSQKRRQAMAHAARATVEARYDSNKVLSQLVHLFAPATAKI
ncbi:glycosyltransferase [Paraferrimonas sedimenticola]|uniref:Uncharacterized protein n=1 Tax=Paraferrimonas sedimenticola TaxID=375674 RepID=A0AA37VY84_9GAMM|nr:glycosyltransferase [Paraferrimonas sedimenticola]GLP96744.1 hypothetical protein GCM10007895_20500 [Paraferrimonas sedimenticola]